MSGEERDDSREPEHKEGKSDEIFEVEKILAHKVTADTLLLKVRWLGYGADEDTWEPESDLQECASEVVQEYYKQLKVNDKTELIEALQKKIKQSKGKKKEKRRERVPSEDEDASFESDGSGVFAKKSKRSKKSSGSAGTPSSSSKTPKVPTKAALKSYEDTLSGPVAPNNAKKTAMEIRSRWLEEDSSDEDTPTGESDIEKIAKKAKPTADSTTVTTKVSSKDHSETPKPKKETKREKTTTPQPTSSTKQSTPNHQKNGTSECPTSSTTKHHKNNTVATEPEFVWTIDGIIQHTDESNNRQKMVHMTHNASGNRKVVDVKDAFATDGWALAKYLLDRCEF